MPTIHVDNHSTTRSIEPSSTRLDQCPDATQKAHAIGTALIGSPQQTREDLSYTFKLRNLIAQILRQLNEISKTDRNSVEELKKKYFATSNEGADLGRSVAHQNLLWALGTLVAGAAVPGFAPNETVRNAVAGIIPDVGRKMGDGWSASMTADKQRKDSLASILVNQFQMEGQKGQNASSAKQELLGILRELLDALKASTRG